MQEVLLAYLHWKLARIEYKSSLQLSGAKGPVVRRALRKVIAARSNVRAMIEAHRDGQRDCKRYFGGAA